MYSLTILLTSNAQSISTHIKKQNTIKFSEVSSHPLSALPDPATGNHCPDSYQHRLTSAGFYQIIRHVLHCVVLVHQHRVIKPHLIISCRTKWKHHYCIDVVVDDDEDDDILLAVSSLLLMGILVSVYCKQCSCKHYDLSACCLANLCVFI